MKTVEAVALGSFKNKTEKTFSLKRLQNFEIFSNKEFCIDLHKLAQTDLAMKKTGTVLLRLHQREKIDLDWLSVLFQRKQRDSHRLA